MPETNAARATETNHDRARKLADHRQGYPGMVAAITAALDEAEERGRREADDRVVAALLALIDATEEHGEDGLCVSDLQAAAHEARAVLYEIDTPRPAAQNEAEERGRAEIAQKLRDAGFRKAAAFIDTPSRAPKPDPMDEVVRLSEEMRLYPWSTTEDAQIGLPVPVELGRIRADGTRTGILALPALERAVIEAAMEWHNFQGGCHDAIDAVERKLDDACAALAAAQNEGER